MLRPEASALEWKHLFPEQREAYLELAELLGAAVIDKKDKKDEKRKHPKRTNRIIFLDGVSGVGKTTIYLSLQKYLETGNTDYVPLDSDIPAKIKDEIVWLDPLELEILNRSTNALADLLVHIEESIEVCLGSSSSRISLSEEQDRCIQKLGKIQNNLAALWDGSSPHRAARVQPEAFAAEVVDTARNRARIREELNGLIDNIAEHFFKNKLIVLPIDDLHEHSHVALDILRLLRIIHSEHFVVFAIGNFEFLRIAEEQKKIREVTTISTIFDAPNSYIENDLRYQATLKSRAKSLASFSLRKQFAESQAIMLHPPDPEGEDTWKNYLTKDGYPYKSFTPVPGDAETAEFYAKPLNSLVLDALKSLIDKNRKDGSKIPFPRHIENAMETTVPMRGAPGRPRLILTQPIRQLLDFQNRLCLYLLDEKNNSKRTVPRFSLQDLLHKAKDAFVEEYGDDNDSLGILDSIFLLNPYNYNEVQVNEIEYRINVMYSLDVGIVGKEREVVSIRGVRYIPPRTAAWLYILLSLLDALGYFTSTKTESEEKKGNRVPFFTIVPRGKLARKKAIRSSWNSNRPQERGLSRSPHGKADQS